jgi:hypothetical protein
MFDTGAKGEAEILWVNYRNDDDTVASLEAHLLTPQTIVPLTGRVIQIVASSTASGFQDRDSLRAFRVPVGKGTGARPSWFQPAIHGCPIIFEGCRRQACFCRTFSRAPRASLR